MRSTRNDELGFFMALLVAIPLSALIVLIPYILVEVLCQLG